MAQYFDVDYVVLCEYSSVSNTNKVLLAGVFGGEANFATPPESWGIFSMVASIIPRARHFNFQFQLVQPDNAPLLIAKGNYTADQDPDDAMRSVFNFQLATAKFRGPGVYRIEAHDDEKIVFSRLLHVNIGPVKQRSQPRISIELQIKE